MELKNLQLWTLLFKHLPTNNFCFWRNFKTFPMTHWATFVYVYLVIQWSHIHGIPCTVEDCNKSTSREVQIVSHYQNKYIICALIPLIRGRHICHIKKYWGRSTLPPFPNVIMFWYRCVIQRSKVLYKWSLWHMSDTCLDISRLNLD